MKITIGNIIIFLCLLIFQLTPGCSGCSKSGLKKESSKYSNNSNNNELNNGSNSKKTIIKMISISGVYQIPVEINGVSMFFIFDTGASTISISETEAIFLYKQGKLSDEDILEKEAFVDANGNISEGRIIILRTVKIGEKVLNDVKASVVHNLNAPLLFGQSALQKFGKVSIDYNKNEITFE
jgi:aspartyl protease family protein